MSVPETDRTEAQRRADRIRAFTTELDQLDREGVLSLPEDTARRVREHHGRLLARLRERFDVDTSDSEKQVSWGMRIASTLGALALAVAAYFFFYRFWGLLTTPVQVAILVGAPALAVMAMDRVRRLERTPYFAGVVGVVAFACFVLDLGVLGSIFNIVPSPRALIPWGAFALILAYAYGLRLMLVAGVLSWMAYLTATVGTWSGIYWIHFGERPENYLIAAAAAFSVPFVFPHRRHPAFPPVYRILGLVAGFLALLVLANWGRASYLRLDPDAVEILYQLLGFLLAGLGIWFGIRRDMRDVVNVAATFFVIFLYTKFFDWWWDWMPKYLFFLVLGSIAVGLLFVLSRVRKLMDRGRA